MTIYLTEKEINDKGWWERYGDLTGIEYWTTPNDEEVSFTEKEYDYLSGKTSENPKKQKVVEREVTATIEQFETFIERVKYNRHTREHYLTIDGVMHLGDTVQDLWDWTYGKYGEL